MMKLLDDHCARLNRRHGDVATAYDFLYLPMDFRVHVLVCLFVVFHFSHLLEQLEARLMIAEHTGQSVEKVSIFC
ncbi:hypothetical protein D1007_32648 [Hordeum vulgare]|nr:hypothetical protein D1007_32648 [Hordeum vulgare]